MDLASIIGLIGCLGIMLFGIAQAPAGILAIMNFIDAPSILITFGGTLMCMLASYSIQDFLGGLKSITLFFKNPKDNAGEIIKNIVDLSNVARKEGLLSLEEAASNIDDEFLKKGILLIVDGTDPELVRAIMETELICAEDRHKKVIGFWEGMGAMGPAWGMIGTLIGLVNMLKQLSDPASVGPNMATALVTTFYGSLLANWICSPVATKMKTNHSIENMSKEIMIEGLLSIQAGENPRVIEEKLKSFISPKQRMLVQEDEGGGEQVG